MTASRRWISATIAATSDSVPPLPWERRGRPTASATSLRAASRY